MLEAAGFEAYEVSNHARGEAARSRHNLAYWRGGDYLGVGPGAHGRLVLDGRRTATRAAARIADYSPRVETTGTSVELEPLDPRAAAEERLMLGLRIAEGVGLSEVAALGLASGAGALGPARRGGPAVDRRRPAGRHGGRKTGAGPGDRGAGDGLLFNRHPGRRSREERGEPGPPRRSRSS